MIIFPALDIQSGKCVRLQQGKANSTVVYGEDPIEVAKRWEAEGAEALHLVDLDGAFSGAMINHKIIQKIIQAIHIPVQLGGGIRSSEDIARAFEFGAHRIILGTSAVQRNEFLEQAVELYDEKIMVSVDGLDGYVAIKGWEEITRIPIENFVENLQRKGVASMIYTDISRDGMLIGPNFAMLASLAQGHDMSIIASGGIRNEEDVRNLKQLGLYGVIIGKALYTGHISLDCLWRNLAC